VLFGSASRTTGNCVTLNRRVFDGPPGPPSRTKYGPGTASAAMRTFPRTAVSVASTVSTQAIAGLPNTAPEIPASPVPVNSTSATVPACPPSGATR
jgi:hypothetical protein